MFFKFVMVGIAAIAVIALRDVLAVLVAIAVLVGLVVIAVRVVIVGRVVLVVAEEPPLAARDCYGWRAVPHCQKRDAYAQL